MQYLKEEIKTEIIMSGTCKLTDTFLDTLHKHFVFKGNEKFANANIFGRITIYQPNAILDSPAQKFSIEKKVISSENETKEFYRTWFSPAGSDLITTPVIDVVKCWCKIRHIDLTCPIVRGIMLADKEDAEKMDKRENPEDGYEEDEDEEKEIIIL